LRKVRWKRKGPKRGTIGKSGVEGCVLGGGGGGGGVWVVCGVGGGGGKRSSLGGGEENGTSGLLSEGGTGGGDTRGGKTGKEEKASYGSGEIPKDFGGQGKVCWSGRGQGRGGEMGLGLAKSTLMVKLSTKSNINHGWQRVIGENES